MQFRVQAFTSVPFSRVGQDYGLNTHGVKIVRNCNVFGFATGYPTTPMLHTYVTARAFVHTSP